MWGPHVQGGAVVTLPDPIFRERASEITFLATATLGQRRATSQPAGSTPRTPSTGNNAALIRNAQQRASLYFAPISLGHNS